MTYLYMLDTNMVSYIARGRSQAARSRLASLQSDQEAVVCISAITEGEIRYGLAKRPDAITLKAAMDGVLARLRVLPWGRDEAEAYGALRAKPEASGTTLGHMDMLIAAHSVSTGAVLVTNDKAFAQVDQLHATVNWATDL